MVNGILINPKDSVVTIAAAAEAGDDVAYTDAGERKVQRALEDIPIYHKIAIRHIAKGDKVLKYGELIGIASSDIMPGMHVHVHNIEEPERG